MHPVILKTDNFSVETRTPPHVSRQDGGHIVVAPLVMVKDRTELTPDLAKELMKLTMVAGEAMKIVMNRNGVDLELINYQENGNFNPGLHIHLYGRARSAKKQLFGTVLQFPPTHEQFKLAIRDNEPLTPKDLNDIRDQIEELLLADKYKEF